MGEKPDQTIVCVRPNSCSRRRKRSFAYTQTQTLKSRHTCGILTAHFYSKCAANNAHIINKLPTLRHTWHTFVVFKQLSVNLDDHATRKRDFHLFCRRTDPLSQQLDEDYSILFAQSQKSPYLCNVISSQCINLVRVSFRFILFVFS